MDIYFRVIKGAREGDVFRIQRGAVIGRGKADINLMDSKVSSAHAKIEERGGSFYYVDLKSTNGSLVDGEKIDEAVLSAGVQISIGRNVLEVITEFDLKKNSASSLGSWREKLYAHLDAIKTTQASAPLVVFEKTILVRVIDGPFSGLLWQLRYGPRFLGPASCDLCLPDQFLADFCLRFFSKDTLFFVEDLQKKTIAPLGGKMNIVLGNNTLEVELETNP